MPSKLSATATPFAFPSQPSTSTTNLPLAVVCRKNEDIGTYEGGVLRPRKGVTSLIAWDENTPFTKVAPSANDASVHCSSPDEDAKVQPATQLLHPGITALQANVTSSDAMEIHGDGESTLDIVQQNAAADHDYQVSLPQFQDFQHQTMNSHQLGHQPSALFQHHAYYPQLPCDMAVSELNRPSWNPAYHKAISPSIERANQVVEEFKLYFGDGKTPEMLLDRLQKICLLCGLCEANNPPSTTEACVTVRSALSILLPILTLTNPHQSNRSWRKCT